MSVGRGYEARLALSRSKKSADFYAYSGNRHVFFVITFYSIKQKTTRESGFLFF